MEIGQGTTYAADVGLNKFHHPAQNIRGSEQVCLRSRNNELVWFTYPAKLSTAIRTACSSGPQTTGQSKTKDTRRFGASPASHPPLCLLCS